MITKDTPMFDNVTLSDIFKKIYNNSESKRDKIDNILDRVKELLSTVVDASIMLPIISEILDTSVRNDEQLVKLAMVIQKMLDKNNYNAPTTIEDLLPEEEKRKLLENSKELLLSDGLIDQKVDRLKEMTKTAKEYIVKTEKELIKKVDTNEKKK